MPQFKWRSSNWRHRTDRRRDKKRMHSRWLNSHYKDNQQNHLRKTYLYSHSVHFYIFTQRKTRLTRSKAAKNPEAAIFVATTLSGFGDLVTRSFPVCGSNSSFSCGSTPRATWERCPWISLLFDISLIWFDLIVYNICQWKSATFFFGSLLLAMQDCLHLQARIAL